MTPEQISSDFRQARLCAKALAGYPGEIVPKDLDAAYQIQEIGISAWPDRVCGWKVAVIQPTWRESYTSERLAGPVFSKRLWSADGKPVMIPVIEGGYAAVEAEFAVCIAKEISSATRFTDPKELLPYIEGVYAAVELAASPLASLNALGPGAVVSDFGNNGGVVIGPKLSIDLLTSPADATSVSVINGQTVGSGSAERVPGGPLTALLFLVRHLGARGRTLSAGDWVSTGATTGIHQVSIGDQVEMSYAGGQRISAEIVPAKATIEA